MQAPELRGRTREVDALTHALEAARAGGGSTVLLEGEAGIGKTRLLEELAARARDLGLEVRRGGGEELEQERPFGPLLEALGVPDMVPAPLGASDAGGMDARFLAQDAFVDHLERLTSAGPTLLVLDDLHWADRATLTTLWAVARRCADMGLLLVLALRLAPEPLELGRLIEGCTRLGALRLRLGPIAEDALAALATDIVGAPPGAALVEQLHGARGNPFVAIELLRALETDDRLIEVQGRRDLRSADLPAVFVDTLVRRVTGLSESARRALSVAAVLGGVGRVDDVAAVLGLSPADAAGAVAEAARGGLLEPTGDVLAFRHDLIREALYQHVPESVRAGWHREAARLLDGRAEPAIVARHLALGAAPGDTQAVDGLRRAAHDLVRDEPEAAADLLATALNLAREPEMRATLAAERAHALLRAHRTEEAGTQAELALAVEAIPPQAAARAHLALAEACTHAGRVSRAPEHWAAARDTGALDDATAALTLGRQAENRLWSFDLDRALEESDLALAEGKRLGIEPLVVEALAVRCAVHSFRAEFEQAVAIGSEAVSRAADEPAALRSTPHAYLGLALIGADRLDEARRAGEEGRRRSNDLGHILALANYHSLLARIAWFSGRWDDAVAELESAAIVAEDFGLRFGARANQGVQGLIALHRGAYPAARGVLESQAAAARRGNVDAAGSELVTLLQAEMMEVDGDVAGASTTLLGLFELERAVGMDAARLWPGPTCVRLALAAGNEPAAREVADDLEVVARRAGTASSHGAAAYARGAIECDGELLRDAATQFSAAGRPLDQLRALEGSGSAHAAADRRDDAVNCLRGAMVVADDLGAAHDARRIRASLRDLGVRIGTPDQPGRPTEGWGSVTDAEREVADLVEDGLRNAEIAERLFVSRRTVETHVSRLYKKLGADNRVALAAAIRAASEPARS